MPEHSGVVHLFGDDAALLEHLPQLLLWRRGLDRVEKGSERVRIECHVLRCTVTVRDCRRLRRLLLCSRSLLEVPAVMEPQTGLRIATKLSDANASVTTRERASA
jgi:hypothetical protein